MASVTDNDPDTLLCLCGNYADSDDFAPCTRAGVVYTQDPAKSGDGMVLVTEAITDPYLICTRCGRVYRVLPIIHINQAFVEHMADLTSPHIAISIAAWQHKKAATRRKRRRGGKHFRD